MSGPVGRHLIVEYCGCEVQSLRAVGGLRQAVDEALAAAGATVLGAAYHQFEPEGASGTVLLAESHLSFHTWPEKRYMAMDVFSCGISFRPEVAVEAVGRYVRATETRVRTLERGAS